MHCFSNSATKVDNVAIEAPIGIRYLRADQSSSNYPVRAKLRIKITKVWPIEMNGYTAWTFTQDLINGKINIARAELMKVYCIE